MKNIYSSRKGLKANLKKNGETLKSYKENRLRGYNFIKNNGGNPRKFGYNRKYKKGYI